MSAPTTLAPAARRGRGAPPGVPEPVIREARSEEYPALEDMIVASYRARMEVSELYESDMRRLAEHAQAWRVWVAELPTADGGPGRPVGIVLTPREDVPYEPDPSRGDVEGERAFRLLTVHPEAAGRGIGHRLIDHAVARIAALGAQRVGIWTGAQMPDAVRLYQSYGFTRHPERETFTVDGGKVPLSFTYDVPENLHHTERHEEHH